MYQLKPILNYKINSVQNWNPVIRLRVLRCVIPVALVQ